MHWLREGWRHDGRGIESKPYSRSPSLPRLCWTTLEGFFFDTPPCLMPFHLRPPPACRSYVTSGIG